MRKVLGEIVGAFAVLLLVGRLEAGPQELKSSERGKGVLDVMVVDETGKRLPGTLVSLPGYRSTTGLSGTCRFKILPGRYSVLISKPGYRGRRIYAGVRPGETSTAQVQLQKLPPARPPRR